MADERETNRLPVGMTGRGLRGRRTARLMIVAAILPAVVVGVLVMTPPNTMGGGMLFEYPSPLVAIVVGGGILGYLIGLAVMIRIYRANPEAHQSFWRSRRR